MPTIAIQAWPYVSPGAEVLERGVRAITSTIRRDPGSPMAGIKSTSRADYVYAKLEAVRAGVDDALFLTTDGAISEGTTANVWAASGRTLVTPPLAAAVLPGTTRTWLLAHAPALGLEPVEVDLRVDRLLASDEAFLSSSVAGLVPLVVLDGRLVGSGRPGPWTTVLRDAREAAIDILSRAGH